MACEESERRTAHPLHTPKLTAEKKKRRRI
jgi:hypothetical protein